jgi:hypothetical protein
MTDPTRAERIHAMLREAAYDSEGRLRGQLHGGVRAASLDQGGIPTPDDYDHDKYHHPDAYFLDTPTGQIQMGLDGWKHEYHVGPGQHAVEHEDGSVSYHPAGVETEPYATRPKDDGSKQKPLPGMPKPTDPALETLRLANPHLNEYRFQLTANPRGYHTITAIHTPTGASAGSFTWKSKAMVERDGAPERAGEVDMIEVKDQHRGRGISTAMWDYAHFHASRDNSVVDHPMHSDNRSIEGNHWAHFVGGAAMPRRKGFGVQRYE